MAFPHPESREDKDRKEDKSNGGGILRNFFKRAVNVAENRNAEDDMNPANDRTYDALVHDFVIYDFEMMRKSNNRDGPNYCTRHAPGPDGGRQACGGDPSTADLVIN